MELGHVLPTPAVGLIDALLAVKSLKDRPKGGREPLIKAALVLSVISCSPSALLGDRTIDKVLGKHVLSAHCVRSSPRYQSLWELGGDVRNSGTGSSSKRRNKWCHIEYMKRLLIDVMQQRIPLSGAWRPSPHSGLWPFRLPGHADGDESTLISTH